MRVLHLFDFYLPSTLSWVAELLGELPQLDVEVGAPWIVQNGFYNPRFTYHHFPLQRRLFPDLRSEFQFPRWQRLFLATQHRLPLYSNWLYQQLKNDPPELLHAHFGPMGCLYLPLAKRLNRPLVVTFYGFDYTKLPQLRPVFYRKYQTLFAEAERIIAASTVGRDRLIELGCPPEKLAVVSPSLRIDHFPVQVREKSAGQLRLVQVATFTAKKGYLTTLEAFRLALIDCPNLTLTLAGEQVDAALVQQIKTYIRDHQLRERITWLDFVEHDRLAAFFGGFDVFIHPSCHAPDGDHEDTPVVILEAQATGLPVLSTRHFNIPAAVLHGETGFLAPEKDAAALANYIRRFYWMENTDYQAFSQAAQQHAANHYDVRKAALALSGIYAELGKAAPGRTDPGR